MKFGISRRAIGSVNDDGVVTVTKILSYDMVAASGFGFNTREAYIKWIEKQKLLENRRKKLEILQKISNEKS